VTAAEQKTKTQQNTNQKLGFDATSLISGTQIDLYQSQPIKCLNFKLAAKAATAHEEAHTVVYNMVH
jgi:hypothetical protein